MLREQHRAGDHRERSPVLSTVLPADEAGGAEYDFPQPPGKLRWTGRTIRPRDERPPPTSLPCGPEPSAARSLQFVPRAGPEKPAGPISEAEPRALGASSEIRPHRSGDTVLLRRNSIRRARSRALAAASGSP